MSETPREVFEALLAEYAETTYAGSVKEAQARDAMACEWLARFDAAGANRPGPLVWVDAKGRLYASGGDARAAVRVGP